MPKSQPPTLPTPEELERLRAQAKTIRFSFRSKHHGLQLWPYYSQIDLLNVHAGSSPVRYKMIPRAEGGSIVTGKATKGGITMEYSELPYEWIGGQWISADIFGTRGPMRYLQIAGGLASDDPHDFVLNVSYVGRNRLSLAGVIARTISKKFEQLWRQIDKSLPDQFEDPLGVEGFANVGKEVDQRARLLAEAWTPLLPGSPVPAALARFVFRAPDKFVARLRPYAVSRQLGLDPEETLRFCLLAVKAGHLNLHWDLICPSCRGAKFQTGSLAALEDAAHCDTCNIRYGAAFDRNVEVTFSPVPKLRTLVTEEYCIQSPSHQTHIAAQQNIPPRSKREFKLNLTPGHYRVRGLGLEGEGVLEVEDSSANSTVSFAIGAVVAETHVHCAPRVTLIVENTSDFWRTIRLERQTWREDVVTAADVTSRQEFRDKFSAEVLRPNIRIGVSNIAILFSDLKDSTVLYESRGDAPAFSLVQQHFEIMTEVIARHRGAVVKTIGDAVMACFLHETDAVRAAIDILDSFEAWNRAHPENEQIIIKLGLNAGPCLALNLNDKLDYFGSTVNRAARIQGVSRGGDLVVPRELAEQPAIRAIFAKHRGLEPVEFEAELKGIQGRHRLVRVELRSLVPAP